MDDWLWWTLRMLGLLLALAVLAYIWERMRNSISARVGIGRFYNRLPRSDDGDKLILNMERLGDFLLDRSVRRNSLDRPVDWEFRLGEDLKRIADIARRSTRVGDV